jgi:hypothetical protein
MSDYITGHAHRTIGAKYGAPTVEHMAAALEKFPRYGDCSDGIGLGNAQPTPTDDGG